MADIENDLATLDSMMDDVFEQAPDFVVLSPTSQSIQMPDQTLCELIPLEPVQETEIAASSLENIVFDEPTLSELNPLEPELETEIAAPSLANIVFDAVGVPGTSSGVQHGAPPPHVNRFDSKIRT